MDIVNVYVIDRIIIIDGCLYLSCSDKSGRNCASCSLFDISTSCVIKVNKTVSFRMCQLTYSNIPSGDYKCFDDINYSINIINSRNSRLVRSDIDDYLHGLTESLFINSYIKSRWIK